VHRRQAHVDSARLVLTGPGPSGVHLLDDGTSTLHLLEQRVGDRSAQVLLEAEAQVSRGGESRLQRECLREIALGRREIPDLVVWISAML
jgi:hypothetical protein